MSKVTTEIQKIADKLNEKIVKAINTKWNEQHSMTPEQIKDKMVIDATKYLKKYLPDVEIKMNPDDPNSLLASFSVKRINITGTIIDQ